MNGILSFYEDLLATYAETKADTTILPVDKPKSTTDLTSAIILVAGIGIFAYLVGRKK